MRFKQFEEYNPKSKKDYYRNANKIIMDDDSQFEEDFNDNPRYEEILEIKETDEKSYSGYKIRTNLRNIFILISNDAVNGSCCEITGYLSSDDNFKDYIYAELFNMEITENEEGNYYSKIVDNILNDDKSGDKFDNAIFVNLNTSNGVLQFVVYNIQNGYYGHKVKIVSIELEDNQIMDYYETKI